MFIIIKPTEVCNLDCAYCFINKKPFYGRMTAEQALKILESIQEYTQANPQEKVTICWHGGEPLTMGVDFYTSVFRNFSGWKTTPHINQTLQTNITLLNDDYCSLFSEYNVTLSTSLDGPEKYHNLSRPFKNGRGSFRSVMRGVELAKKRNIKTGVICMLNQTNINILSTLYDFFKQLNLPYKVNSIHKVGRSDFEEIAISYRQYADALLFFFERFISDPTPRFPESQSFRIARSLLVNFNPACPFMSNCQDGIISVNANGEVFPCESFPYLKNNSRFYYGNALDKPFIEIMKSNKRILVKSRRAETIKKCSTCKYRKICNGGCMIEGFIRRGNLLDETVYCEDIKYMLSRFHDVLQQTGLEQEFQSLSNARGLNDIK